MKQEDYYLSKEIHERIFNNSIIPRLEINNKTPSEQPTIVILGGQPGAGKTAIATLALKEFKENAVMINIDSLREFHPGYKSLLKSDPEKAPQMVMSDSVKWMNRLMSHAIKNRINIIWDNTLGSDLNSTRANLMSIKQTGIKIEIKALAVPELVSKIGIYKRYNNEMKETGSGRILSFENHDIRFKNILNNLDMLEKEKIPNIINLYSRNFLKDGYTSLNLIYNNEQKNSKWIKPAEVVISLAQERERPFTQVEKSNLKNSIDQIKKDFIERKEPINELLKILPKDFIEEKKQNKGFKL